MPVQSRRRQTGVGLHGGTEATDTPRPEGMGNTLACALGYP